MTNVLNCEKKYVEQHCLVPNNNKIHSKHKLEEACPRQRDHRDNQFFLSKSVYKETDRAAKSARTFLQKYLAYSWCLTNTC